MAQHSQDLYALAESYEEHGHGTVEIHEQYDMLEFDNPKTNFRSLGDIALAHGFIVSAWNPKEQKLWFEEIEVKEVRVENREEKRVDGELVEESVDSRTEFVVQKEDAGERGNPYDHPTARWTVEQ